MIEWMMKHTVIHTAALLNSVCVCVGKKPAANDLFGEADDISSDSDAEKPLTPGQPMVRYLHTQPQNFYFLKAAPSHLFYLFWNMIGHTLF